MCATFSNVVYLRRGFEIYIFSFLLTVSSFISCYSNKSFGATFINYLMFCFIIT